MTDLAGDVTALINRLSVVQGQRDTLRGEVAELQARVDEAEAEAGQLKTTCKVLCDERDRLQAQCSAWRVECDTLQARVRELEALPVWIPVEQLSPEVGQEVIFLFQSGRMAVGHRTGPQDDWNFRREPDMFITHWMRMPEPPATGEGETAKETNADLGD